MMRIWKLSSAIALAVIPAAVCAQAVTSVAAAKAPAIQFEDATAKAHIDYTHSFGSAQLGSLLEGTGAGCVWFDYNNNGLPDLYVVNGRPLDDSMHPHPLKVKPNPLPHNHLYRNNGDGTFTDVTDQAGLNPDMYGIAVTAADYDNDGFVDLFVTAYGKTILYHNDGNGHFTDVTEKAGIKVDGWAISSTWLDYDKDGCVDLFVGRYVKFDPKYRAYYAADNYPGPLDYEGETNKLFHNKHDGTIEEVANDLGAAFGQNGESTSSMGPVFADFDGRGMLDLWVTDGHYNRMLHNTGKLTFDDIGAGNGVSQANAQYVSWGTGVYDYDNDGILDVLIFHGGLIHLIPQEHTLFHGLGQDRYDDISRDAGAVLSERTVARGACFADYDNDGKMDAFLVNLGERGKLVHNVSQNAGHWVAILLKGTKSNRDGIGAKVEIFAGAKHELQERVAGSGYLSQNEARLHFGLGKAKTIDKIVVHWPSGAEQTLTQQPVDRVLTVEEPK